jgi:hypothetical protein
MIYLILTTHKKLRNNVMQFGKDRSDAHYEDAVICLRKLMGYMMPDHSAEHKEECIICREALPIAEEVIFYSSNI